MLATALQIEAAEVRPGNVYGVELRAWTVRSTGGRRLLRVSEHARGAGWLVSELGRPLACSCVTYGIRRHCPHARAVALHLGGRDIGAERRGFTGPVPVLTGGEPAPSVPLRIDRPPCPCCGRPMTELAPASGPAFSERVFFCAESVRDAIGAGSALRPSARHARAEIYPSWMLAELIAHAALAVEVES